MILVQIRQFCWLFSFSVKLQFLFWHMNLVVFCIWEYLCVSTTLFGFDTCESIPWLYKWVGFTLFSTPNSYANKPWLCIDYSLCLYFRLECIQSVAANYYVQSLAKSFHFLKKAGIIKVEFMVLSIKVEFWLKVQRMLRFPSPFCGCSHCFFTCLLLSVVSSK